MNDVIGLEDSNTMDPGKQTRPGRGAAAPDREPIRLEGTGASGSEPVPPWLDNAAGDFGAPQSVIDALVVRLGVQPMARLIADRTAFRAALIAEYRRQCARLRVRLLYEEWRQ